MAHGQALGYRCRPCGKASTARGCEGRLQKKIIFTMPLTGSSRLMVASSMKLVRPRHAPHAARS
jgi:hypothetical protein